ncbi:MAG: hypothetical protein ACYSU1_06710 [Planctomycetota bacterium]
MRATFPILLLLGLLPGACQVCPPATQALVLAPSFHTPEDAGRSYFAAMACDDAGAEYRCFGEALKDEYGATLDLYLLARPAIREELGSIVRHAWRLEPLRRQRAEPGLLVWWGYGDREVVGLLMQQQHYFDVTEEDGRRTGSLLELSPAEILDLESRRLSLELHDPVLRSLGSSEAITHFELGTEWKIADFLFPEE